MNRRDFLIHTGAGAAGCLTGSLLAGCLQSPSRAFSGTRGLAIIADPADAVAGAGPARWAADQLAAALTRRGFDVNRCAHLTDAAPGDFCVVAAGAPSALVRDAGLEVPAAPESLAIAPAIIGGRTVLLAAGRDTRGLVYALTEVADAVALADDPGAALRPARAVAERPANAVRSVIRLFVSDVEDKPWFNDRQFWRDYLSLLATERFNRFNLSLGLGYDFADHLRDVYFYFAYPFLVHVPGYDVRALKLPDAERDRNLEMLRFISDETAARGLEFQLGLWTHAYRWHESPQVNYVIEGLTPRTQAPYCRDALALVLKECPNITGVTLRTHGESGVPEGSYGLWRTIFDGCVRSGRRIGLDLHAKGIDQPLIDAALGTGLPVTISPKFWAEHLGLPYHQAAIRPTELPTRAKGEGLFAESGGARSFLRYGYGDLLKRERLYSILYRIWPGTQRVLLSGDPVFGAAYSRAMSFGGSRGAEIFEPLAFKGRKGSGLPGGRDGYADTSVRAGRGEFEKYRYTYRVWGRLLYNPEAPAGPAQRRLRSDYGDGANAVEISLGHASRILPLVTTAHLPSAANNNFWPEMYVNLSVVDDSNPEPYTDTPEPKRFGAVSPLDPQLFARIDDFAGELLADDFSGKYSPIEVAQWLEDLAGTAAQSLAAAETATGNREAPAWRRLAIDVRTQAGLGRFFAHKLRAGVLYALFERSGDHAFGGEAVKAYRAARQSWSEIVAATIGVYVRDLTYGEGWFQRGHWSDRLAAIDRDIAAMERKLAAASAPGGLAPARTAALMVEVLGRPVRAAVAATHLRPAALRPGQPLALALALGPGAVTRTDVQLCYRHAQQAEAWQVSPMARNASGYHAAVPGAYTDSPYPLEYYFVVRAPGSRPWLYPGFNATLTNQPYFVVS